MLHFELKQESFKVFTQQSLDDIKIKKTRFDLIKFFENNLLFKVYFNQMLFFILLSINVSSQLYLQTFWQLIDDQNIFLTILIFNFFIMLELHLKQIC